MFDSRGKKLSIGDSVAFVKGKNSGASIDTGKVSKFYVGHYGKEECSVQYLSDNKIVSQPHLPSFRVMKLSIEDVKDSLSEDWSKDL